MRLHIKLTKNTEIIPFNYQKLLTGCVHKWIGENNSQHGIVSLYSFSWLQNVKPSQKGLNLTRDSHMFFSFHESELAKEVIKGILKSPEMFCGIKVRDVLIQDTPEFFDHERFYITSPILIKRRLEDGNEKHYTYEHEESDELMTTTLKTKLREAGMDDEGVRVYFDKEYSNPKTKIISYGKIRNKANICPVFIEGAPEQIVFAWNVGLGNSTGVGFGSIEKY